jgi:hypothetical protein
MNVAEREKGPRLVKELKGKAAEGVIPRSGITTGGTEYLIGRPRADAQSDHSFLHLYLRLGLLVADPKGGRRSRPLRDLGVAYPSTSEADFW